MNDNTCICCGSLIPEGRQICKRCEEIHDEKQIAMIAKPAARTNGDRIRQMTDEELAEMLFRDRCDMCAHGACRLDDGCKEGVFEWLRKEEET